MLKGLDSTHDDERSNDENFIMNLRFLSLQGDSTKKSHISLKNTIGMTHLPDEGKIFYMSVPFSNIKPHLTDRKDEDFMIDIWHMKKTDRYYKSMLYGIAVIPKNKILLRFFEAENEANSKSSTELIGFLKNQEFVVFDSVVLRDPIRNRLAGNISISIGFQNVKSYNPDSGLHQDDFNHSADLFITVEKALHLPMIEIFKGEIQPSSSLEESTKLTPNTFVTVTNCFGWNNRSSCFTEKENNFQTPLCKSTQNPVWNYTIKIKRHFVNNHSSYEDVMNDCIQFHVWHIPTPNDSVNEEFQFHKKKDKTLIGIATVDLSPLKAGLDNLHGWYHIIDDQGNFKGQLLIKICPGYFQKSDDLKLKSSERSI